MPRRFFPQFILASALAISVSGKDPAQPAATVTVHEWGTFTSVAGSNGKSVPWAPLNATSDLPCFVHQLGNRAGIKTLTSGLIRMETPVVYLYSPKPTNISVHVDFPQGWITEWYPKATRIYPKDAYGPAQNGSIDWTGLSVTPVSDLALLSTNGPSRYFAARATDSALLQSGDESEKLLFYRGVGNFKVPLEPEIGANGIAIHATSPVPLAILFANEAGHIGYRTARDLKDDTVMAAPELTASIGQLRTDLVRTLEQFGLYPREAAAMVETWHDSWFEPGMRLIYIMPRSVVDTVLPLKVTPAPKETQRVFVGRIELLSPWTETTIRGALASGDTATLNRFGRFVTPFLAQMKSRSPVQESSISINWRNSVTTGSCIR